MKEIVRSLFKGLGYEVRRIPNPAHLVNVFDEDGLFTRLNHDFIHDRQFIRAHEAGKATGQMFPGRWRFHVALWAAKHAAQLPGDFVECGVNNGSLAKAILTYLPWDELNKNFHLFDTWAGFDTSLLKEEELKLGLLKKFEGTYVSETFDLVKKTFATHARVQLHRGSVPQTLEAAGIQKVSYLSIDMNCSAPEIAAAEYFWNKLSPGAVIVLDDYGFNDTHTVQKRAFDAFCAAHGTQVLSLPTGQGLIFKS